MKIAIGSDHGGYNLKIRIEEYLKEKNIIFKDYGCDSDQSCDYPEFGLRAAEEVSKGNCDRGILICKSGIGMSIVANKVKGIRAALCQTPEIAKKSREHNDSNILVMAAEVVDLDTAKKIVDMWMETDFEGGRHQRRIDIITEYESKGH